MRYGRRLRISRFRRGAEKKFPKAAMHWNQRARDIASGETPGGGAGGSDNIENALDEGDRP
jgi:hypothetical protein